MSEKVTRIYSCMDKMREPNRKEDLEKNWIDNIQEDCSETELSLMEVDRLARDWNRWRFAVQTLGCQRTSTTSSSTRHSVNVSQSKQANEHPL